MDSYSLLNRLKEGTFEDIERITYGFCQEWIQRVVLECSPHARCAALIVIDAFEQYCNHHSLPPEERTLPAQAFRWVLGRAANVFNENYSPSELRAAINGEPLEPHEATPTTATTPPQPAEQLPLLFATDDEENAKIKELLAALDKAKITEKVLNTKKRAPLNTEIVKKFKEWKKNKELTYFNAEAAFRFVKKAGLKYNGTSERSWVSFIRKCYNEI